MQIGDCVTSQRLHWFLTDEPNSYALSIILELLKLIILNPPYQSMCLSRFYLDKLGVISIQLNEPKHSPCMMELSAAPIISQTSSCFSFLPIVISSTTNHGFHMVSPSWKMWLTMFPPYTSLLIKCLFFLCHPVNKCFVIL